MRSTLFLAITVMALCSPPHTQAQQTIATATATAPYDAVTIKPNSTGSGSSGISINDATFKATNVSLKSLLDVAYDIKPDLISGVPPALESLHFDINAKVVDADLHALSNISDTARRAMLLAVLVDRFGLKAHIEIRSLPLFELTVLPTGPRFAKTDNAPEGHNVSVRNRSLEAHGMSIASFAGTLSGQLHKTVIDKTGLAGEYDVKLKWSAEDADPQTATDPDLYTALQEQLGLKLRPAKGPVPTLVVDHIELPSAN